MRTKNRKPLTPLAQHRIAAGFTQKKLAQVMDVRPSAVCSWEAGAYRPGPDRIPALAHHLGVSPLKVAKMIGAADSFDNHKGNDR